MHVHWAELADSHCDLWGECHAEFTEIARCVDVARGYVRDLRFPLLVQELSEEILDAAAMEADGLLVESDITSTRCPLVTALTFAAHALLYGEGEENDSRMDGEEIETSCRRVGSFILIEKMRRFEVYGHLRLPCDPWDDETDIVCDEENEANHARFMRWLGYPVEETDGTD